MLLINDKSYYSRSNSPLTDSQKRNVDNSTEQIKTQKQLLDEYKEKVKELLDPTNGMSEEEKARYDDKINQKIKNGDKLSSAEMRYIKIKSPYVYAMISRVQMQRQALEDRLKNCHSKEEVEKAYNTAMMHVDKDDPVREPLCAAYDNVTKEFKKSNEYKKLPQKSEDRENKNRLPVTENCRTEEYDIESKYLISEDIYPIVDIKA